MIAAVKTRRGAAIFGFASREAFELLVDRLAAEDLKRGEQLQIDVYRDPSWGVPPGPLIRRSSVT